MLPRSRSLTTTLAVALTLALASASLAGDDLSAAGHREDVEAWRVAREQRLRAADGWLTLVGLAWLRDGEMRVGFGPDSDLVLPGGTADGRASQLGTIVTEKGGARFTAAPGSGLTAGGEPLAAGTSIALVPDIAGEPTVVRRDSVSFYVIDRNQRLAVRIKDSDSPALKAFHGIPRYPISLDWRIEASFETYDPPRTVPWPNALGWQDQIEVPGALVFTVDGTEHRIDARDAGDQLYLVFGDETSGDTTYGGGRFLYTDKPDAEGRVVVDFNKAYNPPCVFTEYATCPLPPRQNKLALKIEAGEKSYEH